jgi:poly-gamma-glutamate synthesis protein (capsule biosynthesis protein)
VQIFTLEPVLLLPHVERGALVENIKRESVELRQRVEEAIFSAKEIKSYDSLVLVGDVMLGRNVEVLMRRQSGSYPFEGLTLSTLAPNPAIIGNFESAMATPHIMTEALQMRFSVDELFLPPLRAAGFSHLSQANNHSFDYDAKGFTYTRQALERHSIVAFGNSSEITKTSISYLESETGTVALVGINASADIPRTQEFAATLEEASKQSAMQIVYIHWGNEYESIHSRAQELLAREMVAAGADLIVGHHPHVVQDIDVIDGVVVFYSLGNYIFDQYFSQEVQEGLVLALSLDETPVVMLVPVSSAATLSQPSLMQPQPHSQFLDSLAQRSDAQLQENIKKGVIPLGLGVATSTKVAMMVR